MRSFLPAVGWRSVRSGDVDTLGGRISGLPLPVDDSEAATKEYVDDSAGDLGGSQPHTWSAFDGTTQAIDGTTGYVNFTTDADGGTIIQSGDTLLDLSDPTAPTFIEEGVYALTFVGEPDDGGHAGKRMTMLGGFGDIGGLIRKAYQTTPLDAGGGGPIGWVGITAYVEAGWSVRCAFYHDIGVDTVFDLNVLIQRIS